MADNVSYLYSTPTKPVDRTLRGASQLDTETYEKIYKATPAPTKSSSGGSSSGRVIQDAQDNVSVLPEYQTSTADTSKTVAPPPPPRETKVVKATVTHTPPSTMPSFNTFTANVNTGVNVVDEDTQKTVKKVQQRQENKFIRPFALAVEGFKQSFTSSGEDRATKGVDPYSAIGLDPNIKRGAGTELGAAVGTYAGAYASAGIDAATIVGGLEIGKATTGAVQGLFKSGSQAVNIGLNLVGNVGTGLGVQRVTKGVAKAKEKILDPKKDLKLSDTEKKAFNYARTQESKSDSGILKDISFNLGVAGNQDAFNKAATDYLKTEGYTNKQITNTIEKLNVERSGTMTGTLTGTLASGAFSEFTGQTQLTKEIAKTTARGGKLGFGNFFRAIAPAGAGEGFTQVILTQENLGDTRGFFEKTPATFQLPVPAAALEKNPDLAKLGFTYKTSRAREAAAGATAGYLFSGALGGVIGKTQVKGQTVRSGVAKGIGYALDPTEYPSDILAGFATASSKNIKVPVSTAIPSFISTSSVADTTASTPTDTSTKSAKKGKTPKGFVNILIDTPANNIVPVPTEEYGFIFENTPTDTDTDTRSDTDTDTSTDTDTDTGGDTPVNIFSDTPVNTNINTNVNVNPNVPVNPFTPVPINRVFKGAIPILPAFNLGGGGATRAGRKKGATFQNELAISTGLFKQSLGIRTTTPTKKTKRKTKKKTSTKKPRKEKKRGSTGASMYDVAFKRAFGIK